MSPSLRFLALLAVGWAGFRAATFGVLPGAELLRIERSEARPAAPPIVPTQFAPIAPVDPASELPPPDPYAGYPMPAGAYAPAQAQVRQVPVVYYPAAQASAAIPIHRARYTPILPEPAAPFYPSAPLLDQWPLSRIAATSLPPLQSRVAAPGQSLPAAAPPPRPALDRIQLSAWALLRSQRAGIVSTRALAGGGQLGGSQAGARLSYHFNPQLAAVVRTSSEVGRRGGEVAAGVRVQPVRGIPLWMTAERRQRLGRYGGGRNAFAIFAEAGVWDRPMPWRFSLDAYLQAGVVGFKSRDRFVDGGLTLTRPVYRNFSAGVGVWGGAQPGVSRLDAGPRLTMKLRRNVKVHLDWRQRVAGNAEPGSGAAVTLAGDF